MSVVSFINRQTEKVIRQTEQIKQQQIQEEHAPGHAEGRAEAKAEDRAWVARMHEDQARGETFDEPFPGDEESEDG